MTITINLEPETEAILLERAARVGQGPGEYAGAVLADRLAELETVPGGTTVVPTDQEPTLAELFAGRTGKINSGGRFNYSRDTGKAFTESLLKQREQKEHSREG